jgi:alpha-1,2-mannosyltransferase
MRTDGPESARRRPGTGDVGSIRQGRRVAWLVLATSCAAYVLVSLAHNQAFHPWVRLDYFDLKVYRAAGELALNGRSLYDGGIWQWAPFSYPPFAAIWFVPLALLPLAVDELLVTVLNLAALFAVLALALRLPAAHGKEAERTHRWWSVVLPVSVAAALWLEPITATLGYGQINLLIALLVVYDLSRRDTARSKGALIGLSAGLKLTPLIFVPYLFFSGRRRAAFVALGTFASTVAVGYALLPGDTQRFWSGTFLDSRRLGSSWSPANQSLRGAILRLDPAFASVAILVVALIIGIVGVTLAVLAARRGDQAIGFCRCAITGLLVSPVSWSAHWTLAVPALLVLGVRVFRKRSKAGITALATILLVGYAYLPTLMTLDHARVGVLDLGDTLASGSYVLIGLVALSVASIQEIRMHTAVRWPRPARRRSVASPQPL